MRQDDRSALVFNSRTKPTQKARKSDGRAKAAWLALAVAPAALMLSSQFAHAATETWTGTTDTEWLTPGNWTGGNAPPQTGDTIVFSGTSALNTDHNLGDGFSLASIQFTTGAGAFVLTSNVGANNQSLVLTGALIDNAASGPTAQTINFAINGTSTSSLQLGADKSAGNSLTLGANSSFGSMTVSTLTTTPSIANTLNIGSTTLNINGAFTMGNTPTASDANTAMTVVGSGTWNVTSTTNTNFKMGIGTNNNTLAGNAVTTLDMSGLANFSFSTGTGNFLIGSQATRPAVTLKLANTSNTITSNGFTVGDSGQSGSGDNNNNKNFVNLMSLGAGTNIFNTNTLVIGQTKTAAMVNYQGASGSVIIRGEAGGVSTTNITVGRATAGSNGTLTSSLLLANNNLSSATVQAGTVIVGQSALTHATNNSTGVVTFDTGTFTCTSLALGTTVGTANITGLFGGNGTFTLGTNSASTGVLTVTSAFTLAGDTGASATNAGTSTGTFIINGGTANINANIAVTSTNAHSSTTATLTMNGGVLNMNGFAIGSPAAVVTNIIVNMPGGGQTATLMNLGGNGIFANNGTGATGGSGLTMGGTGTLILAGTNNSYTGPTSVNAGILQIGSGTLGGSVPAGTSFTNNTVVNFDGSLPITIAPGISGGGVVNQNGTGTTTLSGSNGYGGDTNINAGVLAVTGSISGNVNISPTATGGTLAGTGSVGNVTMSTGGAIHPGATGADLSVGTLNVASMNVSAGDMRFDIGGASGDSIVDSGSATFTGGTVSIALDSAPTLPSYVLLTASGGLSGTPTLSTTSIGRTTFALATVGNQLKLNVSGGPAALTWNHVGGTGDGHTWNNLQNNQNWSKTGSPDTFFDADTVTFNDSNGGNNAVTIATSVSPGSVTFTNATAPYVFTGTGGIAGTTGLTMNGAGSVTFQTVNTYAGNTNINAGTLTLSSGGSISSGNFNVGGGAVNVNNGGSLGSANININSGSLSIASGGSLTNLSPIVTVAGGASMTVASGATMPASLSVIDNGTVTVSGGVTLGALSGTGIVNINGGALTISSGGTVDNTLQNGVSSGGLTVVTGPALILTAANLYTGATTINSGGTLQVGNSGATGSLAASSVITNAGTLTYNLNAPSTVTVANSITNTGTVNFTSVGNMNVTGSISNAGTVNFNSAGNMSVTGAITGAGTLRQTGAGITTLGSDLSGFTGGITLGGGTLVFNYASPTTLANPISVVAGTTSTVQNVGKLTMSGVHAVGATAGAISYNVSPVAGLMPSGVPADVEITASVNRNTGSDGIGIIKTGTGVLAISGVTDNASLGINVSGGTLLLNKASATTIHSIGGGGLIINSTGTAKITGTGGEQIYNAAGGVTANNGGTFDLNGQNQGVNNLTFADAGGPGIITNSAPGTASVLKVGTLIGTANDAGAAAAATIGRIIMTVGSANVGAVAGSTLEIQSNGLAAQGGGHTLTDVGPGTVFLTGVSDNAAVNVAVTNGMLVLGKTNSDLAHAASAVVGVSAGATLQLSGTGNDPTYGGNDQIYNGFITGTTDYGVLNMNGTFDLNGQSEAFDKLTGTGSVINSQSATPVVLTLGTNNGIGPSAAQFDGTISGNIGLNKVNAATPPDTQVPVVLTGVNTYSGNTNVNAGILTISATGSIASPNVTVATGAVLNVDGLLASTANVTSNGVTNFGGTTGITPKTQALSTLAIGTGVTISITPSAFPFTPTILKPTTTNFADASSLIDITNNAFATTGTAAGVLAQIQSGQIFTSQTPDAGKAIGYINLGGADAGKFEVRYTLKGDANLDGTVDVGDLGALATSYGVTGGKSWANGDFNQDSNVDVGDLGALATNYGTHLASGPSAGPESMVAAPLSAIAASSAAVPEPTSLGLLGISALGLVGRRKRK